MRQVVLAKVTDNRAATEGEKDQGNMQGAFIEVDGIWVYYE